MVNKKTEKFYEIPDTSIPRLPAFAPPEGFAYGKVTSVTSAVRTNETEVKADAKVEKADKPTIPAQKGTPAKADARPADPAPAKAEAADGDKVPRAKGYKVPKGYNLPNEGKTLGEVLDANQTLGVHLLRDLSGKTDGKKMPVFTPPDQGRREGRQRRQIPAGQPLGSKRQIDFLKGVSLDTPFYYKLNTSLESVKLQGHEKCARGAVFFDLLSIRVSYFATSKEHSYYI